MNESEPTISQVEVDGDQVYQVILGIEPALEGVPRTHGIIATLSIATMLMHPGISQDRLHDCVKGASEFIALFVAGPDVESIDKSQLN